jgi:predicted DNA-binding transcriptional regulator AlpA
MSQTITGVSANTTFLNQPAVCEYLQTIGIKMSRSTFLNGVSTGRFPAPSRPTPSRPVWKKADIDSLVAAL